MTKNRKIANYSRLKVAELKSAEDVGYANCAQDVYDSLGNIISSVRKNDLDPLEILEEFRVTLKKALDSTKPEIH
jgi:hypothetical protein